MIKKLTLAILLALGASTAQAQTLVTIYGLLDTGVEHVTNVGPGGDGLTRVPSNTATLPSRIGFRGAEDLGNGLKAIFTLENGLSLDSGLAGQGGRLFGRQAFVGLSGEWGQVTVGRHQTYLFWSVFDSDLLGPNLYGSASLDSYIPNARADNSVAYRGTFKGVTIGAMYSLGRDTVNAGPSPVGANCAGESPSDDSACRGWSAMLKYDSPTWGVAAAYDRMNGGPGAFGNLVRSDMHDTRATINGYVKFGATKVGGGVIRRDNDGSPTPKSNLYFVGAAYSVTPAFTIDGEVLRLDYEDSSNQATVYALRGMYSFSRRTAAYVTVGHISNDGTLNISVSSGQAGSNPVAGGSQKGVMVGLRHAF